MTNPLQAPMQEILTLPIPHKPLWAAFDAAWYLRRYNMARRACGANPQAALEFYLSEGVSLAHSPNPLFDETFYRATNPDLAILITAGDYASGFEHFCKHGHQTLSPHWLFDDALYARLHDDMSIENLRQHGFFGRYDHYLKSGQHEKRQAHYLFDPAFYRQCAIASAELPEDIDQSGPYTHFLNHLQSGRPELPPSIYFDPAWYIAANAGAQAENASGQFQSSIENYLLNTASDFRDPVAQFSELYYREINPDVQIAIDNQNFRSGYQHFIQFGAFELRRPHPAIDLVFYRDMNQPVRDALNSGTSRDAFAHLREFALAENLPFAPAEIEQPVDELAAKKMFLAKAKNHALTSHQPLNFHSSTAKISVIMVLFNQFELTLFALASLRANYADEIELILVDNASLDATKHIEQNITGAHIIHLPENIGFLKAANIGISHASASSILFLNNDIELGFGAINAALARLHSAPDIAAVGGKIIRTHGKLQEAGSLLWRDGSAKGYLRDASPLAPEANFLRQVDFCSAVFLLCRTSLVNQLGGFDAAFSPSYYEDADLCLQLLNAGYRVMYDPAITIHHVEYASATHSQAASALMRRGQKIFQRKHRQYLAQKPEKSSLNIITARQAISPRKRVLYLEDTIPLRHLGSGFVRSHDIATAIATSGYDLTIYPINGTKSDAYEIHKNFDAGIEILYNRDINDFYNFFQERRNYYNLIWVARTHNLNRLMPIFEELAISPAAMPIILDTEALSFNRLSAQVAFTIQTAIPPLADELRHAHLCRHVLAVNNQEAAQAQSTGLARVSVLGTPAVLTPTPATFSERENLLFVASIHADDSPNLDSLFWYQEKILPELTKLMPNPPLLNFVGYIAPHINLTAFANQPGINIIGPVANLAPYYNQSRVFIAPTRFAAGTPYKIHEAAGHGLPCVATTLLSTQLGWVAGEQLLQAPAENPASFAQQIFNLYQNQPLWETLRQGALQRLERENSQTQFTSTLQNILQTSLQ